MVVAHLGARVADDGEARGQTSFVGEAIECWEELALSKVAICPEYDNNAGRDTPLKTKRVVKWVIAVHLLEITRGCADTIRGV
jgi:hypothetical protein